MVQLRALSAQSFRIFQPTRADPFSGPPYGRARCRPNGRITGDHRGEELAAQHFERLGYDVLARHHRTRYGELDLMLCDGDVLVFVEVKTRRARPRRAVGEPRATPSAPGAPHGARLAGDVRDRPRSPELRFDAVGVTLDAHGELVAPRPPGEAAF